MLTKNKIKQINKDGWYWAEGSSVMCNYGDTHTFTFCMCRNHKEAQAVASGLNVLDWNDSNEEEALQNDSKNHSKEGRDKRQASSSKQCLTIGLGYYKMNLESEKYI